MSYNERIIKVDYEDEMRKSYIDYAMSVIVQRAIPDVRDGLKPVHRRILYAMDELHLSPEKLYRKSARIVGDTMGKYHPHGDSSIYLAMVRMAQDYSLLLPLVDGHGNFGSIDGDAPAAMRYTEARLSKAAMELLKDMDKSIVDFRNNFDGSLKEPVVLPSRFPNLLVNGATGIAVGMKTDIPPHNLNEVVNACKAYLDNEDITIPQLRKHIKGADFPTGGIIVNKEEMKTLYETGNGKIKVRSKIEAEPAGGGKTNLVITEIPYSFSGNKTKLIEGLIEMVKDRKLDELSDVRDESNKDGIRIVLEVKRGINVPNLLNKLFQKTKLEDTIAVNFLAIVDGKPEQLNLRDMIVHFVDFQKEINLKKYQHMLDRANDRKEIVEGLVKAQDIIDLIIEVLRGSKDVKTAKDCLINGKTTGITFKTKKSEKTAGKLNFTERQATAILDMKLQKLIGLELKKLLDEEKELMKQIVLYEKILSNKDELVRVIKEDLEEIKKRYGKRRKTAIEEIQEKVYVEETTEEVLVILIDRFGYVKTVDMNTYGRVSSDSLTDYKVLKIMNTDKLAVFTKEGNLHQVRVSDLPHGKMKDKGVLLDTLCDIKKEEILHITSCDSIKKKELLFVTEQGFIKLVSGEEFESIRRTIGATKLDKGDRVVFITPIDTSRVRELAVVSEKSMGLKFLLEEVPLQKKNARGVVTLKLTPDDKITHIALIGEGDMPALQRDGKPLSLKKLKTSRRNSKGTLLK